MRLGERAQRRPNRAVRGPARHGAEGVPREAGEERGSQPLRGAWKGRAAQYQRGHCLYISNIFNGKKSLIFSMGRNPEHFQWEEILNIFNGKKSLIFSMGKILNIFNGKKSLIFSMGEILNIFNGKKSLIFSVGRSPQYIPNTDSYTTKRLRTV